jgi:hypothetical protein
MGLKIMCQMGLRQGRPFELVPGRPIKIRMRSSESGEGQIVFNEEAGICGFTVEGPAMVRLNGIVVTTGRLGAGDRLAIGKMLFTLLDTAASPASSPATDETEDLPCADDEAGSAPRAGVASLNVDTDRYRAQTASTAARHDGEATTTRQAKTVPIHGRAAEVVPAEDDEHEETVAMGGNPAIAPHDLADGGAADHVEGDRRRRRLSASQDSIVSQVRGGQDQGILKKMARMFKRTDVQAVRLRELLADRENLYHEAGRLSLRSDGGMGLPENLVARLLRGDPVNLTPAMVDRVELQRFSERCKLLRLLDAEIYALRDEMGIAPGTEELPGGEVLRTEHQDFEDRAFQASDVVLTQDLEENDGVGEDVDSAGNRLDSTTDSYTGIEADPNGATAPRPPARTSGRLGLGKTAAGDPRNSGRRRAARRHRRH